MRQLTCNHLHFNICGLKNRTVSYPTCSFVEFHRKLLSMVCVYVCVIQERPEEIDYTIRKCSHSKWKEITFKSEVFELQYVCRNVPFLKPIIIAPFIFLRFYLFNFRQREREEETGDKYQCIVASYTPDLGPGLQPRHMPSLGIKPATFWFTGWYSIH